MPVNKVHCHARAKKGSFEVLELQECLDCAASGENKCQMTGPMVRWIHDAWKDSAGRNPFSASKLGTCPRRTVLQQKFNWGSDPMNQYSAMRGTLIHDSLHSKLDNSVGEVGEIRIHKEFNGVKIGGQFDLLQLKSGILYDYKTTTKLPPFQYCYVGHKIQMNIYRWLLDGQVINEVPVEIKEMRVQYITGDGWKQCKAIFMDMPEVEAIMAKFIDQAIPALEAGDNWMEFLPPVLPYDHWECNYCELRTACYHLKDQQLMEQSMEEGSADDDIF